MRLLSVLIVAALSSLPLVRAAEPVLHEVRSLQGFWFGTGSVRQFVLLIEDEKFIVTNRLGSQESTFTVNPNADLPAIDVVRNNGKVQKGVYQFQGDVLEFTLADPGLERPAGSTVRAASGLRRVYYRFVRQPSPESLETLKKQFPDESARRGPTIKRGFPSGPPVAKLDLPKLKRPLFARRDAMIELKRILLATDLSEYAGHATNYACELADRFEAELHVLYVFNELLPSADWTYPQLNEHIQEFEHQARR